MPLETFDAIWAGVAADRSQFFMDLTMPFYGFNRPGAKLIKGAALKVCPGLSHGMCTINKDLINSDLLAFIQG